MAHVCVKSMNWANCQQMMNRVVVTAMESRWNQEYLVALRGRFACTSQSLITWIFYIIEFH